MDERPLPNAGGRASPALRAALAALPFAAGCVAPPREDGAPASAPGEDSISGQLTSSYRGRFAGGEDDHDLHETLDLALEDPAQRWSASVLARAVLDIDGRDTAEDELFFSLQDTYDHRLAGDLYHAYVDVHQDELELLRVGRQPIHETPVTVLFDGVRAETEARGEHGWRLGAYGGAGEHPYESSNDGDLVLGLFGTAQAWSGAALRADWMHLEDHTEFGDHADDLLGLSLWQDIVRGERRSTLETRFTALEGNGRDLRLAATLVDAAHSLSVQTSFYQLLQTQESLAAPLDPFFPTLFELLPYYQLTFSATKDWERFALLGGADLRQLVDSSDEGEFNHDFTRFHLTASLSETLPVILALTGEVWRADDNEFETWGGSLSRELEPNWDVSLGSFYSLFKYDLFSSEERDHVRTTFLDLRWRPVAHRRWNLRYEFEENDFDDFHQVRLDFSWGF